VILVGVSRSGKTPTSLYLAMQYGVKAANYPLIPEDFERGKLPSALTQHREKLRPVDRPAASVGDPQRAPSGQQVRGAGELPLRDQRSGGDDAPRRHQVAVVDAQVDRGNRDDDPAGNPPGAAVVLTCAASAALAAARKQKAAFDAAFAGHCAPTTCARRARLICAAAAAPARTGTRPPPPRR
jgi:hypothetical protein